MRSILCILFVAYSLIAYVQELTPKPFEYPYEVLVYDLPTASNGVDYRLYIRTPLAEPKEGEKASTFYFLDALKLFTPAASHDFQL